MIQSNLLQSTGDSTTSNMTLTPKQQSLAISSTPLGNDTDRCGVAVCIFISYSGISSFLFQVEYLLFCLRPLVAFSAFPAEYRKSNSDQTTAMFIQPKFLQICGTTEVVIIAIIKQMGPKIA
jgi:hypothetical protein